MHFAANISTMFREVSFPERFSVARERGFRHIEMQFPYDFDLADLKAEKDTTGLNVVLMNSFQGKNDGEFGCASIPGRECDFLKDVSSSISYTFALQCRKLHIIGGMKDTSFTEEEQRAAYINCLTLAIEMLEEHGIIGLIEPICPEVKKGYYMDSFDKAVSVLKEINSSSIKLLLDIYHLHKITGNVMENLPKLLPYAAHIQVSQSPNRSEPFQDGEINYAEVFEFLQTHNYNGFIGLEYYPSESTDASLQWMTRYQ